jgi:hypothetical protein
MLLTVALYILLLRRENNTVVLTTLDCAGKEKVQWHR